MFRLIATILASIWLTSSLTAAGVMLPTEKQLPPLAIVHHRVNIMIEEQVAITTVEQAFRNHTDRNLEAVYLFPVPKGASLNKFTMWVDGKETAGELLDAKKAAQVYADVVRRTQDPALLEYIGNDMLRLRVFPVPPKKDQKIKLSFTTISAADNGVIEYLYPLKTDGNATKTLEEFQVKATIKSQHAIQNVYSPTHAITLTRKGDKEVGMSFERQQTPLDKDFQLFYSLSNKEIGITPVFHRPISSDDGYFLMLISPQIESAKTTVIPRDLVLVMDTSGSMDNVKMDQAKKALKHCLGQLRAKDRFAIITFSTNVRKYRDTLVEANEEQIDAAKKWVDGLKAGGGTAIQYALDSAMEIRPNEEGRSFTVVFFTDGQPTIGEMKPEKIVKNVADKHHANTRIFTFGVGDDVNTALLDQLAEQTKAISTYVRPAEDIETKVSSLYGKISHPVLANVKLSTSDNIRLHEIYPIRLPDLFFGSQLIVLGKYTGDGATAVKIGGQVGKEQKEYIYEVTFPKKSTADHEFVEHLWARRKVGYLLDQLRINGEQKELMEEMVQLAKKYGVATPYTSYLVVPDAPMPITRPHPLPATGRGFNDIPPAGLPGTGINGGFGGGFGGTGAALPPTNSNPVGPGAGGIHLPRFSNVREAAKAISQNPGDSTRARNSIEIDRLNVLRDEMKKVEDRVGRERLKGNLSEADAKLDAFAKKVLKDVNETQQQLSNYEQARQFYGRGDHKNAQSGGIGVDVAVCAQNLKSQERLSQTANRFVNGRNCLEVGGLWIDDGYNSTMKSVVIKAQSNAYFKILENRPEMKEVFKLGNHLVYVLPNGQALLIDSAEGQESLTDEEVTKLFQKNAKP